MSSKPDKIFNNVFEQVDVDYSQMSFKLDEQDAVRQTDEKLDEIIIAHEIQYLIAIKSNAKYSKFIVCENSKRSKLSKIDINFIYDYVITNLPQFPKVEIFSVMCDMYDVNPVKMYDSLSNVYKLQLIEELKRRGTLEIPKLF